MLPLTPDPVFIHVCLVVVSYCSNMSETDSSSGLSDKALDEDSTSDEDDHDDNSMMEAEFNVSEPVYGCKPVPVTVVHFIQTSVDSFLLFCRLEAVVQTQVKVVAIQ